MKWVIKMKKLTTLMILSFTGINAFAYCPINVPMWQMQQCMQQEEAMETQSRQQRQIIDELDQIKRNQRFAPKQCFRDYFGTVQCY